MSPHLQIQSPWVTAVPVQHLIVEVAELTPQHLGLVWNYGAIELSKSMGDYQQIYMGETLFRFPVKTDSSIYGLDRLLLGNDQDSKISMVLSCFIRIPLIMQCWNSFFGGYPNHFQRNRNRCCLYQIDQKSAHLFSLWEVRICWVNIGVSIERNKMEESRTEKPWKNCDWNQCWQNSKMMPDGCNMMQPTTVVDFKNDVFSSRYKSSLGREKLEGSFMFDPRHPCGRKGSGQLHQYWWISTAPMREMRGW